MSTVDEGCPQRSRKFHPENSWLAEIMSNHSHIFSPPPPLYILLFTTATTSYGKNEYYYLNWKKLLYFILSNGMAPQFLHDSLSRRFHFNNPYTKAGWTRRKTSRRRHSSPTWRTIASRPGQDNQSTLLYRSGWQMERVLVLSFHGYGDPECNGLLWPGWSWELG